MPQRVGQGMFALILSGYTALLSGSALAGDRLPHLQPVHIVGNDYGGVLATRLRAVRKLRESGARIEVRGQICFSTCTLYIGLPHVCILPDTIFGFHGPSRLGVPLEPVLFENASRLIAAYYPAPLKQWYLTEGRYRIHGVYRIMGADLIRMGVPACAPE